MEEKHILQRAIFVNFGIGTSALKFELELELELILQTPLFPVFRKAFGPQI